MLDIAAEITKLPEPDRTYIRTALLAVNRADAARRNKISQNYTERTADNQLTELFNINPVEVKKMADGTMAFRWEGDESFTVVEDPIIYTYLVFCMTQGRPDKT